VSENTKETILDAAKRLFIRFGKRKTSVDEIARTAQVGKGTVYFHFKSKEEIWDTIVGQAVNRTIGRITEALEKVKSAMEKLRVYIKIRYQVFREELDILNIQQGVLDELFPEITDITRDLKTREMGFLAQIINYGIERGEFRRLDVELLSMIMAAALEATGEYWIKQVRLVGAEAAMDNLLNVFFHGLLTTA
jgi:AcrR family transcriptional regulator